MIRKTVFNVLKKHYKVADPYEGLKLEEIGIKSSEDILDVLDYVSEKIDFDFDPEDEEPNTVGDLIELIKNNLCE